MSEIDGTKNNLRQAPNILSNLLPSSIIFIAFEANLMHPLVRYETGIFIAQFNCQIYGKQLRHVLRVTELLCTYCTALSWFVFWILL